MYLRHERKLSWVQQLLDSIIQIHWTWQSVETHIMPPQWIELIEKIIDLYSLKSAFFFKKGFYPMLAALPVKNNKSKKTIFPFSMFRQWYPLEVSAVPTLSKTPTTMKSKLPVKETAQHANVCILVAATFCLLISVECAG